MTNERHITVGDKLGSYELIDHLGFGGAGKIFLAKHLGSDERVAMKVLRPDAEADEDIHGRFIREISVAQKLNDPHIVAYRDCGVEDGILYFTMEYVPWGSLADVLHQRSNLPWKESCQCGEQICMGLHHLHESNIIHRDLKPANIFLSDDGRLKLGDFGLARDFESHRLTVDGIAVGTGRYLAPEQAKGESDIDGRTDLYALGCTMFELLTGHTPYDEHDVHNPVHLGELMRRHVDAPVPKVSDFVHSCPPVLSQLIEKLLAKDPRDRPKSAHKVARMLGLIQQDPEVSLAYLDSQVDAESIELERVTSEQTTSEHADGKADERLTDVVPLTETLRAPGATGSNEISTRGLAVSLLAVAAIIALAVFFGSSS